MKFTLLMEDSKGRRDGMRVIANNLPEALFCFAVDGEQEHNDFVYSISTADEPFETYSSEETEKYVAWIEGGNTHGQKTIKKVN